ncbi:PREDICTED: NACHT, LRR and PYD domains-containing protein 7-like [Dipodomys ordii]|uniref:NACHT, LRR and PYD domains-containing protein 7-like n=1 Tax=Dipodomys ordii TaxID=10020 RepID=A0A1S3G4Z4_DIPOR|nr:PREDICTED: NACHT, LRR and PYD domains-containing protein 7-like [Dipodomys ordii]
MSLKPQYNLKNLLDKLDHEELRTFKSLLKPLMEPGVDLRIFPWDEVEEASGSKLAEILEDRLPRASLRKTIWSILEKMELPQILEDVETPVIEEQMQGEELKCGEIEKSEDVETPVIEEQMQREELKCREMKKPEDVETPVIAEQMQREELKCREMEKPDNTEGQSDARDSLARFWKSRFCLDHTYLSGVIERNRNLIPFLDPQVVLRGRAVVLHGPPGAGKTTVARKLVLEWADGSLAHLFSWVFYLSCRELAQMAPCTLVELLSHEFPELESDVVQFLEEPQEALIIIDGLEKISIPRLDSRIDLCMDWLEENPVPVLLSSLLQGTLVPNATLLITTTPSTLRELITLVGQVQFCSIPGFSEADTQEFFLRHFRDQAQAQRALEAVQSNEALLAMSQVPSTCRLLCTCLEPVMERGEDPTTACQTPTALLLHCFQDQFCHPRSCPSALACGLETLCRLAAQGLWAQTSVFYLEDLEKLGVEEISLHPFLDKCLIQKDLNYRYCSYSFIYPVLQQFLAALFYVLKPQDGEGRGRQPWDDNIEDVRKLFSREAWLRNPDLAHAGHYLFGLLNRKRAQELEATFGCHIDLEIRRELLGCGAEESRPFLLRMEQSEVFSWLYESQDEEVVREALAPFEEMSVILKSRQDLLHSSFCLKHCPGLHKLTVQVARGLLPENDEAQLSFYLKHGRFQSDSSCLSLWLDLCSSMCSNPNLSTLSINQSFLSSSSVQVLSQHLSSETCRVNKVLIQYLTPEFIYPVLCLGLIGKRSLTHLALEGRIQEDQARMLLMLGEMLKNQHCGLQSLRLGTCCNATPQQWADFFLAVQASPSLTALDLTDNKILDQGSMLLCETLMQPLCSIQKLSLENCQLTQACCKKLASTLIISQLTHLSLANNDLGDEGVKILCEGLNHPDCQLQSLVLRRCNIRKDGCRPLSRLLQTGCSLTSLDLSMNFIDSGLWMLCDALRRGNSMLRTLGLAPMIGKQRLTLYPVLGEFGGQGQTPGKAGPHRLWGCAISPLYCQELAMALHDNQELHMLDLGQNNLGKTGVQVILEALKTSRTSLKTLRLKMDESSEKMQNLLQEVKKHHPGLVIEEVTSSTVLSYWDFFSLSP